MASKFRTGLSGGAALNNFNILLMNEGRTIARYTDKRISATIGARDLVSRLATAEIASVCNPYTLKTS